MAINRGYVANHKIWDEIGRITPIPEYSESHRPHIGRMVAPWLPVARYEEENKGWKVVSAGKVIGETSDGRLVPAGLRKAWNIATSSTAITYTTNDVTNLTQDIVTGVAVTAAKVAAGGTYTEDEVTIGLRERGLIQHTERAMDFISPPIGIAPYDYYAAASYTDNSDPRTFKFHNYSLQDRVAVVCDYVAQYPVLPALATTETVGASQMAGGAGLLEDVFDLTVARASYLGFYSSTQISAVTRYNSVTAGDDVVCLVLANYPIAVDTAESTIAASVAGLVREVDSISAIRAAGDYYWDYDMGILFLYEADGDAVPSPWVASTSTITYYHYATEGSATNTPTTYSCATGDLKFGHFVTYDKYSNIVPAVLDISAALGYNASYALYSDDPAFAAASTTTHDEAISLQIEKAIAGYTEGIVGQVIGTEIYGEGRFSNDYLDRVRTVMQGQTDATYRNPGTATGGRTDHLTYAKGAEKMVMINLIMR